MHFAYGSNMSRRAMEARCPGAEAVGPALLQGYRFIIMTDGYASVEPAHGHAVHGVMWRLTARDLASLNAYESLQSGLYRRAMLPVLYDRVHLNALVYLGRTANEGRARPGYMEQVLDAAREWELPQDYIETLRRWAPSRWRGPQRRDFGDQ
ncbi:MAG: gamma-glutamylcyclotransferase [Pseudorhodoplanes sp.]|nr:gamma-glutamylcyclotransferase [Pseudorhodoplanes sp.]